MRENKQNFLVEILKAEQMLDVGIKNAEKKAQKIVADAQIEADDMRRLTIEKLKFEQKALDKKFEQKLQKLEKETFETATAEANKLKKDVAKKIDKVANDLAMEVLEEC